MTSTLRAMRLLFRFGRDGGHYLMYVYGASGSRSFCILWNSSMFPLFQANCICARSTCCSRMFLAFSLLMPVSWLCAALMRADFFSCSISFLHRECAGVCECLCMCAGVNLCKVGCAL